MKLGLGSRIAITTALLVLVSTATVGYMVYRSARSALVGGATDRLAHTAEVVDVRFRAGMEAVGKDVIFLAETPPVQGMVRALSKWGLDPQTAILHYEWADQLAATFQSFLYSRPSFLRARFISVRDGGRELVRVERLGNNVVRAPVSEEDRSTAPAYVTDAAELPAGRVYFSAFSPDASASADGGTGVLLHAATPVYTENGDPFGVVVVDVDFSYLSDALQALVDSSKALYFAAGDGHYLIRPPAGLDDEGGDLVQNDFPAVAALLSGASTDLKTESQGGNGVPASVGYFRAVLLNRGTAQDNMVVGIVEPQRTILARVERVRSQSFLVTMLFSLIGVAVALALSNYVTRPLRQITRAVIRFGRSGDEIDLPTERDDEIGILARNFDEMAQQIQLQIAQLETERTSLQLLSESLEERVHDRTESLQRSNEAIEQRNRELRDFTHVAAHDLQEPLRRIQAFADMLRTEKAGELAAETVHYIERMVSSAERMSQLVAGLQLFSSITARERALTRVDLNEVAEDALQALVLPEDVSFEPSCADLPEIEADRQQMRQLLDDLLANAVKFRRENVPLKIRIWSEDVPGCDVPTCAIHVADNGIGFDEKYLDRIFSPFQRLHTGDGYGGTGIGLTVCRKVAENHGGSITAHSSPGEGATFVVTLPLRQSEGDDATPRPAGTQHRIQEAKG